MTLPESILRQTTQLFKGMDQAYHQAAAKAGFACNGCKDNCCLTRFDHHTLLELLYLRSGLAALTPAQRSRLDKRAHDALRQMADLEGRHAPVRVMCPLNETQRCMLYTHRPMICRLHGTPHILRRPDGKQLTGPGCDDFYDQCGKAHAHALDRTPWYVAMAQIESELRRLSGFKGKIKMTIAEMIVKKDDFAV
jgi:Fe-S-cluster containining protein